ncbi:hypothetical protein IAT38_002296 [Cryptococcus sp. DSM 104549]
MATWWDIISATLVLAIFIGVVYFGSKFAHLLDAQSKQTTSSLQSRGVDYSANKISVKTDRAAPSREEYISNMQGAFKRGAHTMKAHRDAFAFKKGEASPGTPPNEKKGGFMRTKKLD